MVLTALGLIRFILAILDHIATVMRGDAIGLVEHILPAVQLGRFAFRWGCNFGRGYVTNNWFTNKIKL